jgi:uncharacterized membrane protein YphA (DoxX/SURF4 family)
MAYFDQRLSTPWWALRIGFGVVPFLAGLDKFFNILTNWEAYLNPMILKLVPVSATTFMYAVGVIEMVAGIAVLTRWTRLASYVVMVWLIAIALSLVTAGNYLDVAVRDLVMSIGAYTLARLTEVREAAGSIAPRVHSQAA